jgi:hypothetical protein
LSFKLRQIVTYSLNQLVKACSFRVAETKRLSFKPRGLKNLQKVVTQLEWWLRAELVANS